MAIPKITKQYLSQALEYIDQHGVPVHNQSTKYSLVLSNGKRYPPKYVIAVAHHLETGVDISTAEYNAIEARNLLMREGYEVETKQSKYELTITQTHITSTDPNFDINDPGLGDNYMPVDAYFKKGDGSVVRRNRAKNERKQSNQVLPRLAFQLYEHNIAALSAKEKELFPVCKYKAKPVIAGIFNSIEEYKKHINSIEYLCYSCGDGQEFIIYCWNIFSTLLFVQECLKRFGYPDDAFILIYQDKLDSEENDTDVATENDTQNCAGRNFLNKYTPVVLDSKNVIFRGAPGTGKSYLAKAIAADIVSNGTKDKYNDLSEEEKKQVAFVQFHPSYDYSDFVEGLRPVVNNGQMGFELRPGIFKSFVAKARKNFENDKKSPAEFVKEQTLDEQLCDFLDECQESAKKLQTVRGNEFIVVGYDDKCVNIHIPGNEKTDELRISIDEIRKLLMSEQQFDTVKDIRLFFGKNHNTQQHSYEHIIYKGVKETASKAAIAPIQKEPLKKYVFIIDEINRGEISKILGELFFSIDPGYRGEDGAVFTQYANLHDADEKFYIPDNVYIIGTMNDIDRSVDTFDFAMRRRFRFIEIDANAHVEMLDQLNEKKDEAVRRMAELNKAIEEKLNKNYQIGGAYFLKLKTMSFEELWSDQLEPLLQEYVNGAYDEKDQMEIFRRAYALESETGEPNDAGA